MSSNLHSAWAKLFVRSLVSAGVHTFVVSPGSRSTPLALAVADEPAATAHVVVDERAAGFFALGHARVTGRPAALLCTSGTAGAHYFPAVIEASQAFVPLVVLTADRPWEAYDAATSQTVDQHRLYGRYVRHFAELGLPDASPAALDAVVRIAAQAVSCSLAPTPGPVHVNARFRKPLEPIFVPYTESWETAVAMRFERGATAVHATMGVCDEAVLALGERCARARRGVIACGPSIGPGDDALRDALGALSRATGFPILAEATSGARFGIADRTATVCPFFDLWLRSETFRREHAPDLVLQVGLPLVSGAFASLLAENPATERFVIAPHGWNDPYGNARGLLSGPLVATLSALARAAGGRDTRLGSFCAALREADARARAAARRELDSAGLTEGGVAYELVGALPARSVLVVGNSTPVRDLDTYCDASEVALNVLHQRGAAGIDGLVAGAAGASAATTTPVALLLGDLSLLHDVGALELARRATRPLLIVVVNNDGGRIFEQLPIGQQPARREALDRFFVVPHGLRFEHAAALFGIRYAPAETPVALASALRSALAHDGCTLVEALVAPGDGALRRARAVAATLVALEGT